MCVICSSLLTMTFIETVSISLTEYPTGLLMAIILLFQAVQLISNSGWEQLFLTPLAASVRLHEGTICSKGFGTVSHDLKNGVTPLYWCEFSHPLDSPEVHSEHGGQYKDRVTVGRVLGLELEAGCAQLPNLLVEFYLAFYFSDKEYYWEIWIKLVWGMCTLQG